MNTQPTTKGHCIECTDMDTDMEMFELFSVNGSMHLLCTSHAAEYEGRFPETTFALVWPKAC